MVWYGSVVDQPSAAKMANEQGRTAAATENWGAAIHFYREAGRLAPGWFAPWLNLGIAHKHVGEWVRSLECSLRALEIDADAGGEARAHHGAYRVLVTARGRRRR